MTQPNPSSGAGDVAQAARPRWRRITAGVLLGLAILAIVLGPIMLYARSQLLDSGEFRARAKTALASPDAQDYVADALTANPVARGGADAERAEPLVRAVVGGVVASGRFQDAFGRAVGALHDRLLDEGTAQRVPVVAFVLVALSIAVAPERLRATRRAGWGLIAGGIVVTAATGLRRRSLLGIVDEAEVRRAVGEAESARPGPRAAPPRPPRDRPARDLRAGRGPHARGGGGARAGGRIWPRGAPAAGGRRCRPSGPV